MDDMKRFMYGFIRRQSSFEAWCDNECQFLNEKFGICNINTVRRHGTRHPQRHLYLDIPRRPEKVIHIYARIS